LKYKTKIGDGYESPENDAVLFYTLNHCASIVRGLFTVNEPLPEWAQTIMTNYTDVCMTQGERMLHYILCITVREMRHLKSHGAPSPMFWTKVEDEFGPEMRVFLNAITSQGGEETAMHKYMHAPPMVPIVTYMKALSYGFHKADGWCGEVESYGGPKWGHVTDAATAMLTGVTSMEMLVDTGYTLAHNGGPIFNKTEVKIYANQNASALMTVLDVQRSGQMLDLMLESNTMHVKKTPEAIAAVELIKTHCPLDANGNPTIKGHVDWQLVSDLRPEKEKKDNPSKYVKAAVKSKATVKKAVPVTPPPPPTPTLTHVHGKKVKVTGSWQVYPNQTVTTYERLEK
jgi:hypothetical protein